MAIELVLRARSYRMVVRGRRGGRRSGRRDRAAEVELTACHPRSGGELPVGVTRSLTDPPPGLDGEWRISETSFGDEVLTRSGTKRSAAHRLVSPRAATAGMIDIG